MMTTMFELGSELQSLIKKACKGKNHIKLTIGCVLDGEKTIKVFDENGEIQNENYVYEIASITKTFTASLLAKYIHENKISLNDSIRKCFVGLDANKYYPTFRRLATHTAGYSAQLPFSWYDYLKTPFVGYPQLVTVERLKHILEKKQLEDRDYKWVYSNYGFTLLGYAVGEIFGKGYWNAMDDFLSNELGLTSSYTGTFPEKNLHGFNKRNKDCGNYVFDKSPNKPSGEGDISATAEDLLTYAQMNMHEEKPYFALCHKKHATAQSMLASLLVKSMGVDEVDMGLGWMLYRRNNRIIWHSGDSDSFSSYLGFDKDKKVAVTVLSNYKMNTTNIGVSILAHLSNNESTSEGNRPA